MKDIHSQKNDYWEYDELSQFGHLLIGNRSEERTLQILPKEWNWKK